MDTTANIKLETEFANAAYQDFKSKRFGLTPCCYYDLQAVCIKRQACGWETLQAEILTPSTVTYSIIDCSTTPPTNGTLQLYPPLM